MRISIYTTGGSIDKYYDTQKSAFLVGEPAVGWVLAESNISVDFTVFPICRKDSLEITDADRMKLREQIAGDPVDRIMVTHGTDSMIETARFLMDLPGKVIVVTGSMQPATFRYSDAPFNVGCAFGALQVLPPGVYLAMNGRVFDPRTVVKNVQSNRFDLIAGN
ncbi:MAG: asparaginase domain-containing protein [Acidobacteriota bacterium]|nr:asparaginase domain-containing protein [Acidobacteriota bacterium]